MASTSTFKETVDGFSSYVGTGNDDRLVSQFGPVIYYGLQGDDLLSTPYRSYGDSAAFLVGGSGNDTYKITANVFIDDAGSGTDSLYFPLLSYSGFNSIDMYSAEIEERHLLISDGDVVIIVNDYKTQYSAIENVEFSDGTVISLPVILDTISLKGNYLGDFTWYSLVSGVGGAGFSEVTEIRDLLSQTRSLNNRYESEADFSRDAEVSDVQTIARLYKGAFDRAPDITGLNSWVEKWEENWSDADIARALIDSDEFKSVYGSSSTNSEFVTALYQNALGREPDQAGYDSWVNQLDTNQISREDAMLFFCESDENKVRTDELFGSMQESSGQWSFSRSADAEDAAQIARLYKAAFNREPDNEGLNNWIDQWEAGTDVDDIAEAFVESAEFNGLYTTVNDDSDFVDLLYQNALGRTADDGGRAHWTQQMQQGVSREELLISFSDSTENQTNTAYQMYSSGDDWFFS